MTPVNTGLNCSVRWRAALGAAVGSAVPHIKTGAVRGIFLGDEIASGGALANIFRRDISDFRGKFGEAWKIWYYVGNVYHMVLNFGVSPS